MHFPFELGITNSEKDLLLVIILNNMTAYFQFLLKGMGKIYTSYTVINLSISGFCFWPSDLWIAFIFQVFTATMAGTLLVTISE